MIAVAVVQSLAVWPLNQGGLLLAGFLIIFIRLFALELYRKELKAALPQKWYHYFIFILPPLISFFYATMYLEPKLPDKYVVVTMLVVCMDALFLSLVIYYCLVRKLISINLLMVMVCVVVSDTIIGLILVDELFIDFMLITFFINAFTKLFLLHSLIVDVLKKDLTSLRLSSFCKSFK